MPGSRMNRFVYIWFMAFGVWAMPSTAFADMHETAEDQHAPFMEPSYDLFAMVLKVIFSLLFVLAVLILTVRLLKSFAQKNRGWFVNQSFRPLGGIPLGADKSLQLVQIGRSVYVLGVDNQIRLIDKINDEEEVKELLDSVRSFHEEGAFSIKEKSTYIFRRFLLPIAERFIGRRLAAYIRSRKTTQQEHLSREKGEDHSSFQNVFASKIKDLSNRQKLLEEWMSEQKDTTGTGSNHNGKERDLS